MFKRKKEVEEYTVESFKETSVMLTTQNGSMEVQKYKLPLELEIGDILIQNEFGIYEKIRMTAGGRITLFSLYERKNEWKKKTDCGSFDIACIDWRDRYRHSTGKDLENMRHLFLMCLTRRRRLSDTHHQRSNFRNRCP